MLEALKSFLSELGNSQAERREFGDDDYRLAAAALLVHVADADGIIDAKEQKRLRALLSEKFGLDSAATARLIGEAIRSDRESVDLYRFTSVLTRTLDHAGRVKVVEMMWDMAYADGHVVELAENIVWRVAELLGVSSRERIALRQRISANRVETDAEPAPGAGPWARPDPA